MYFTVDEGKTYFADSIDKDYSFEYGGKIAYRAYVFKYESGGQVVGFLGRRAKTSGDARPATYRKDGSDSLGPLEIKRSGDAKWVSFMSPEGQSIVASLRTKGTPEPVLP